MLEVTLDDTLDETLVERIALENGGGAGEEEMNRLRRACWLKMCLLGFRL